MDPTRFLALVLAGGEGTRLLPLTAECAKPALPFAGGYRIVDFVLSNLVNSGISSIYVLAQYKPQSLIEHIRNAWAPWRDGERFIEVVLPATHGSSFKGTADAVYQNLHLIDRHRPDLVAVFASDHVYRMDVGQMAFFHQRNDAHISIAAVPVPIEEGTQFGIVATTLDGRVTGFQENPSDRRQSRMIRAVPLRRWGTTCSNLACWRICLNKRMVGARRISADTYCRARGAATGYSPMTFAAIACPAFALARNPITGAMSARLRPTQQHKQTWLGPSRDSAPRMRGGRLRTMSQSGGSEGRFRKRRQLHPRTAHRVLLDGARAA